MKLEGKSLKSDFLRFIIPSIIAQWVFSLYTMVDGIFVARGVSEVALTAVNISMPFTTGLFSVSILFAVGNSTIVAIFLGQGGKTEGERSLYAECGLIMYPVGVDYNTGYDISGSICKIPWSNGSYSSICENIYWNDRTIFCSIYPILFI